MTEPLYSVVDKLCETLGPRQHELPDPTTGHVRRFKFVALEPTPCPRWAAKIFERTGGFDVTDPDGNPFKAAPKAEAQAVSLAPDEVVAQLSELTQEALLARCLAADAKCGFNKAAKKGDLVAFLMERGAAAAETGGPATGAGTAEEELEVELEEEAA